MLNRFSLIWAMLLFPFPAMAALNLGANLGFRFGGGGEETWEIEGDEDSLDYDDETGMVLSGHLLAPVGESFAIGGRIAIIPDVTVDKEDFSADTEMGKEIDLSLRGDYRIPVQEQASLHVIGEGGLGILFPDDDFQDTLEYYDFDTDPRLGFKFGGGVGFTYALKESIALRADLLFEYLYMTLIDEEVAGSSYTLTASGTRFWLLFGMEFTLGA